MKKYSLFLVTAVCAALSVAACNVKVSTNDETKEAGAPATASTEASGKTKVKDPVCGMEMEDEKWTEFAVSGTDTTWFCSPHCKDQFVKHPEKYKQPAASKS